MRLLSLIAVLLLTACAPERSEQALPQEEAAAPAPVSISPPEEARSEDQFDPKAVFPKWYEPTEPFLVMDNLYYVGSRGLAVWFLPTQEGHIVIDGGAPETAEHVIAGIRKLGFDPADIAILLNTHAHFDHSGGLAELKDISGAQMIASEGDRSALEGGFYLGSEDEAALNAPPVKVDRIIGDGEVISLGGTELTARLTPGHSRGCTSWLFDLEAAGETFNALIFCSATVAANRLIGPPQYEGIVEDYRATFERVTKWTPDIFLANHPEFFNMEEKYAAQQAGNALAFVDQERFPKLAARLQRAFEKTLAEQSAAAQP